jgi:hypothetical protein
MKAKILLSSLVFFVSSISLAIPSSWILSDDELKNLKTNSSTNKIETIWYYKIIFPTSNPYTTKSELIKIEWLVWDNVHFIVVDDYKLKKYKPWDTKWYYYAAKKYGSLKDWLNTYKIKYYWKNWNLLKEDEIVIYKKENNRIKVNEYEKKLNDKLKEVKNIRNKCASYSIENYDSLVKRKAKVDYYRKKLNRQEQRNLLDWIMIMDKYKYFYNNNTKTCVAKKFFRLDIWFDSFDECNNLCIKHVNNNLNTISVVAKTSNWPINNRKLKLYSQEKLSLIADSIIRKKSWDLSKLQDLQSRVKKLIQTLKYWNLQIKYNTKINFLNLLNILDEKLNEKINDLIKINDFDYSNDKWIKDIFKMLDNL